MRKGCKLQRTVHGKDIFSEWHTCSYSDARIHGFICCESNRANATTYKLASGSVTNTVYCSVLVAVAAAAAELQPAAAAISRTCVWVIRYAVVSKHDGSEKRDLGVVAVSHSQWRATGSTNSACQLRLQADRVCKVTAEIKRLRLLTRAAPIPTSGSFRQGTRTSSNVTVRGRALARALC